jgi:hypothetical protein
LVRVSVGHDVFGVDTMDVFTDSPQLGYPAKPGLGWLVPLT